MKKIVLFCLALTLLISGNIFASDLLGYDKIGIGTDTPVGQLSIQGEATQPYQALIQLAGTVSLAPGYNWMMATNPICTSDLIGQQVQVNGVNYTVLGCTNAYLITINPYTGTPITGKAIYKVNPEPAPVQTPIMSLDNADGVRKVTVTNGGSVEMAGPAKIGTTTPNFTNPRYGYLLCWTTAGTIGYCSGLGNPCYCYEIQ